MSLFLVPEEPPLFPIHAVSSKYRASGSARLAGGGNDALGQNDVEKRRRRGAKVHIYDIDELEEKRKKRKCKKNTTQTVA